MQDASNQQSRYSLEFTGTGWQYFKIWIVNILLTILTLYIYSAWAKVRTKRYFYGNTVLDNSSFEYHAKGSQIILGRIIAAALVIAATFSGVNFVISIIASALLLLLLPWAVWRSLIFNARMSSYRNLRFNYQGKLLPLYGMFLVLPFLPLALFSLLGAVVYYSGNVETGVGLIITGVVGTYLFVPWVHQMSQNHIINRYKYGTAEFSTKLSTRSFYAAYIVSLIIWVLSIAMILVLLALAAWAMGLVSIDTIDQWIVSFDNPGEEGFPTSLLLFSVFSYLVLFVVGILSMAYLRSRIRSHTFGQTSLNVNVTLESTVSTWPLFWISFSNAVLVLLSIGLVYPWTKVRMARYMAANTAIYSAAPLDNFVSAERDKVSALGEELGDAFDMDVDMGF